MKEYIERSAILDILADPYRKASDEIEVAILKCWDRIKKIPAADVVEVKLLDDGTLVVTTDKYPHVNRVFVEDGKTSGSLFYAEEV